MIYSLKGEIVDIGESWVAIDLGSVCYEVLVPRPEDFSLGESLTLYTEEILTQDDHYLVGFRDKLERTAFLSLISVKGIGPKTALSALSKTSPNDLFEAISKGDARYLKKLPGIGPKAASQIILDLKGKLVENPGKASKKESYPEVRAALRQLGYKAKDIDDALSGLSIPEDQVNEALKAALLRLRGK